MTRPSPEIAQAYNRVMEQAGFYHDGHPVPSVIDADTLRENADTQVEKSIKYKVVIDPSQLNARAIFELSSAPCIYFTSLAETNPDQDK
ncbi:MAG TPA: hypothetical protein VGE04_02340, partial [Chloroflexia bacterium]